MLRTKRVYLEPSKDDGIRILVDRLWPRGLTNEKAHIDFWYKTIAPSDGLRKLFHQGSISFGEFRKRYLFELSEYKKAESKENSEMTPGVYLAKIFSMIKSSNKDITLLYGAKDEIENNAVVLKEFISKQS